MRRAEIAKMIDHTFLKLQGSEADIARICCEAVRYGFASVAILPTAIPFAHSILKGTEVKVVAALSFFRGRYPLEVKLLEIENAIDMGAEELDLVMSVNLLKERKLDALALEFSSFVRVAGDRTTKVILETCLLTDDEKVLACQLARDAGATFVKTSTGLKAGATTHDVALMRHTVGRGMGVKASGGIRDLGQALEMIKAGANRLGTSAGVSIIEAIDGGQDERTR